MATTAVFAEILIVGLQVEAWIVLLLLSIFGTEWIHLSQVKDFATLLTVVVLALAYVLGIILDRLADTLLDRFEKTGPGKRVKARLSKNAELEKPAKVATMRMKVMLESDGATRFLDYQRSRWRIARATVVNLAIAGPAAALYLARTDVGWPWALVPPACALVLIPTTYFAGIRIQDAWIGRLADAYTIVTRSPRTKPHPEEQARIVAAVCHQRGQGGVEFLLVRTKRGKCWTFPKGHVEPGERSWEAAAREAREEAGAEGDVSSTPLTEYRYPDTRGGEGDSVVTAYLLAVSRLHEQARKERRRERRWVASDEAVRLLTGEDREPEYAEEHARVVREAVAALSQPV